MFNSDTRAVATRRRTIAALTDFIDAATTAANSRETATSTRAELAWELDRLGGGPENSSDFAS